MPPIRSIYHVKMVENVREFESKNRRRLPYFSLKRIELDVVKLEIVEGVANRVTCIEKLLSDRYMTHHKQGLYIRLYMNTL